MRADGRILITGGAGRVGTVLRRGLAGLGWRVRCLDLRVPDGPDADADADARAGIGASASASASVSVGADASAGAAAVEWVVGDVTDLPTVVAAMADVDVVIHLAGIPAEDHFARILHANIEGTQKVFEAAVRAGVPRVLFASTNHVVGYYERSTFRNRRLGTGERTRPDTLYGVSKVFGEALASYYHDRHGLQVACVRIGAFEPEPRTRRMLDTWFSPGDAVRLFHALAVAPNLGYEIVFGVSANPTAWADLEPGWRLGYEPRDDSSVFAARFAGEPADSDGSDGPDDPDDPDDPADPADPEVRYLGGDFTTATPD